jgi:hypothetical protein
MGTWATMRRSGGDGGRSEGKGRGKGDLAAAFHSPKKWRQFAGFAIKMRTLHTGKMQISFV